MLKFDTWKIVLILFVCFLGPYFAFPNILSEQTREWADEHLPAFIPTHAMSLGLDLQGGSHLQLQVDTATVVADRLEGMVSVVRSTLKDKKIAVERASVKGNSVVTLLEDVSNGDDAVNDIRVALGNSVKVSRDGAEVTVTYTDLEIGNFKKQAIAQSIEIIRRRIDETGTKEPVIQAQGDDRIIVQLPGMKDPERVKELLGKTARLTFHMVDINVTPSECLSGQAPLTVRCLPMNDPEDKTQLGVIRRALLTGDMLVDAQPGYDISGRSVVNFRFDAIGAKKFADVTRNNVGKPFAIVLDDVIITAPRINEPIIGGSGQISGNFTVESANDLSILLRAGALPAPLKVVEERTVGPSLGADSIHAGRDASIAATLVVMAFMFVIYGRTFGLFINFALVINMMMMIGLLSMIGATLTLPGIVGIVLSIGMAVDANVLIFERMREEIRAGRSVMPSIDYGFQGAMSSIMDANMTTVIAGLVLYLVGTGPVRGFAVTLVIGIITSLFTSIYLTRLVIVTWANWRKPKTIPL